MIDECNVRGPVLCIARGAVAFCGCWYCRSVFLVCNNNLPAGTKEAANYIAFHGAAAPPSSSSSSARAVHAIEPGELENIPVREAVLCDHVPPS